MLTNKQFSAKLNGVIKSAKSQREAIQALIASGIEQYKEHGDTGQLSRLIQAVVGVRSLPTNVLRDYIKAHANVMFTQAKDKSYVFKKLAGEKSPEVKELSVTWYDWEGNGNSAPKTDFDVMARVKSLMTSLTKAIDEHKIKEGQHDEAEQLKAMLATLQQQHADAAHASH